MKKSQFTQAIENILGTDNYRTFIDKNKNGYRIKLSGVEFIGLSPEYFESITQQIEDLPNVLKVKIQPYIHYSGQKEICIFIDKKVSEIKIDEINMPKNGSISDIEVILESFVKGKKLVLSREKSYPEDGWFYAIRDIEQILESYTDFEAAFDVFVNNYGVTSFRTKNYKKIQVIK